MTVYTGKGKNTSTKRYMGRTSHLWNNSGGDSATLRNSKGTVMDRYVWKKDIRSYLNC